MPGIDANTKLMLHLNNDVVDATSRHTVSNNNVTFSTSSKFGSHCGVFNGSTSYLTVPNSVDFDLFDSTSKTFTLDLWLYMAASDGNADIIGQLDGVPGNSDWWDLYVVSFSGYKRCYFKQNDTVYGQQINLVPTAQLSEDAWHHIAVISVNGVYGFYFDGTQVAYDSGISNPVTYDSDLLIGTGIQVVRYFSGCLDELRLQYSNYFNANPNSGLTDTISIPTEEYSETYLYIPSQGIIII